MQRRVVAALRSCSSEAELDALVRSQAESIWSDTRAANFVVQAYGRCGSPSLAEQAFRSIQQPNVYSWNMLLVAVSSSADRAKAVFDAMPQRNVVSWNATAAALAQDRRHSLQSSRAVFERAPAWTAKSWASAVAACAHRGLAEEAMSTFGSCPERGAPAWNSVLDGLAASGHLQKMVSVAALMPQYTVVSWTTLLSAVADQGLVRDAWCTFKTMPERNVVAWTAMLTAFADNGQLRRAKEFFDKMPQRNVVSWNSMVHSVAAAGSGSATRELFGEMPERNAASWAGLVAAHTSDRLDEARIAFELMPHHSAITTTSMIHALSLAGDTVAAAALFESLAIADAVATTLMITVHAVGGCLDEAVAAFVAIERKDAVAWAAIASAYAQAGRLDDASMVLDRMPQWSLSPWNSLLTALAAAGRSATELRDTFGRIPFPEVSSRNILMEAHITIGDPSGARVLFESAPHRDVVSWTLFLQALDQRGDSDSDRDQLRAAFERMAQHNSASCTLMVAATARQGFINRAISIFENMPHRGLGAWNAMVTALSTSGHHSDAIALFTAISLEGLRPNDVSFLIALAACSYLGLVDRARSYLVSMDQDYGVAATREHYACVVDVLARAGRLAAAQQLVKEMPFHPNAAEWGSMLAACRLHGDLVRAKDLAGLAFTASPRDSMAYELLANTCLGA